MLSEDREETRKGRNMIRSFVLLLAVCVVSSPASGELLYFDSTSAFVAHARAQGYNLEGVEDFEENNLGPNQAAVQDEPLDGNPNVSFPNGLDVNTLSITSSFGNGVTVVTDGFNGVETSMIGADLSLARTSVSFLVDDYCAVGLDIVDFTMGQPCNVGIFDLNDQMIEATVAQSSYDAVFFGVVSDVPIGRIEVASMAFGNELLDNIQVWAVPEPGTAALALLCLVGFGARRCRS
jgi:hypothetical protein